MPIPQSAARTRAFAAAVLLTLFAPAFRAAAEAPSASAKFLFNSGDKVAWIGSSSTKIGVWPKTIEFLLRTRHPDVSLEFRSFTTGGGTFGTGLANLDKWLAEGKPTVVLFNYGGNDAKAGEKGLPKFRDEIDQCVAKVKAAGARVIVMTHQSGDARKAGEADVAMRKTYAEALIAHCQARGLAVIDTHHPLETLQAEGQKADPAYTILKDKIHLTEPAYIAWGCLLYERLGAPPAVSLAEVSAVGKVGKTVGCKVAEVSVQDNLLSFVRRDAILPLLPPVELPPRKLVPLEAVSQYRLKVTGLAEGTYEVSCQGKPVGSASAAELAAGVNLNSLLLDSGNPAPWAALAKDIWQGKSLDQIGKTAWKFEVRKK